MVGNDVVDLALASQSDWQRKGFLEKIFTDTEQRCILNSETPFKLVWLFWSMKESAYKIYMQQGGKRMYAPQKFECFLGKDGKGEVCFENNVYTTSSVITKNYIHTISYINEFRGYTGLIHFADTSARNQSEKTYKYLKKVISTQKKINSNFLKIIKSPLGIPQLHYKGIFQETSFSLSHHGNHGAIVVN